MLCEAARAPWPGGGWLVPRCRVAGVRTRTWCPAVRGRRRPDRLLQPDAPHAGGRSPSPCMGRPVRVLMPRATGAGTQNLRRPKDEICWSSLGQARPVRPSSSPLWHPSSTAPGTDRTPRRPHRRIRRGSAAQADGIRLSTSGATGELSAWQASTASSSGSWNEHTSPVALTLRTE